MSTGLTLHSLIFLILSSHWFSSCAAQADSNPAAAMNFIKASCKATLYPLLCVQSLSVYAPTIQQSQKQLAQAALAVSLTRARSAAVFVYKLRNQMGGWRSRELQAVNDCIDNMGDSVDQLSKSLKELGQMGRVTGQDFMWHVSNVQTWASAALTDENTCLDGFSGPAMSTGYVKVAIRSRILHAAQFISNALALINRFAERHHAP